MIRLGIMLLLIGLFVSCFFITGGGQLIDIGKWLILVGIVCYGVFLLFGRYGGPPTVGI